MKSKNPWDGANDNVTKTFNLRLPETLYEKLKYLAETGPESMHSIAFDAVKVEIEKRIAAISKNRP